MSKHCETCTNAKTPICNSCSYIETSKGESRPTQYIGRPEYSETSELEIKTDDVRALIQNRISNSREIPLRWVLEYNKYLEVMDYGKWQT